jgi:hypothetical protein
MEPSKEGTEDMGTGGLTWPSGKSFAFTVVDDTDFATVRSAKPVYDFLLDCGMRTTKTVWPLRPIGRGFTGGWTLEDEEYRNWTLELQQRGVEIALHGVADGSSERARVKKGLDYFRDVVGADPTVHTNHVAQGEGIYWGPDRLDGPLRWLYRTYRRARRPQPYDGARPDSPQFWGDICSGRIKYVRNFVFEDINTLKMDALMPYHDARRPYVRYWFSASNGDDPEAFCRLLSEANQDRLEAEGGACIVYTHFGLAFHRLPATFRRLVTRLSLKPGWFEPATPILDYIGNHRGCPVVGEQRAELNRMQWRWAWERSARQIRKVLTAPPTAPTAGTRTAAAIGR